MDDAADLKVALELADVADALSAPAFGNVTGERKADGSAVSAVDREIETSLRSRLAEVRPADAIVGEELGGTTPATARRWLLDPLDGTEYFLRGIPTWATMIALQDAGTPVAAVVSAPALRRRWWAAAGHGAFCNGAPLHVSTTDVLAEAFVAHSNLLWSQPPEHVVIRMLRALRAARWSGGFESFTGAMLVAMGAIDAALTPVGKLWDHAPVTLIVEEAGGHATDFEGVPNPAEGMLLVSNSRLHDQLVAQLRATGRP